MKTGRNEPCPCGSGRKFKRCCGDGFPSRERFLGGYFDKEKNTMVVATNDILRNAINRDAPDIARSFDQLCGGELAKIDELYSTAAFVVLAGMKKAAREDVQENITIATLLYHTSLGLSAATQLVRLGYPLSVGVIVRNVLETIATVLHLGTYPEDLQRFRDGELKSSKTFSTATKIIPILGRMNGILSDEYVHLGKLYAEPQPFRKYDSRQDGGLDTALGMLKMTVWLFYLTAELQFHDMINEPRYWKSEGTISENEVQFLYSPSPQEQKWTKEFLGITPEEGT